MDGPAASASNSESPSFCLGPCSAEGRAVSGPAQRPEPACTSGLPHWVLSRWRVLRAPPSTLSPASPSGSGRRVRCCTAEIGKLNFPDVQAPGACACRLERKWGLGRAAPYFLLACSPCFSGATKHSRSRKSRPVSVSRSGASPPAPRSPARSCQRVPQLHWGPSGQPQGQGPGEGGQVPDKP